MPGPAVHRPRPRGAPTRHRHDAGITERSAYGIVTDLTEAGYVVKERRRRTAAAIATRSRLICR